MSKYLPELIRIARDEMPNLEYDVANSVTPLSIRETNIKLFAIMGQILHHAIHDALSRMPAVSQAPRPAPAPVQVAAPVARPLSTADALGLPTPPSMIPVVVPAQGPQVPGIPDDPVQAGVANVFITTQGTSVIGPGGRRMTLPPNETQVPIEATAEIAPVPPPAPDGGISVVLPPGGGMTPEVAAALGTLPSE